MFENFHNANMSTYIENNNRRNDNPNQYARMKRLRLL